MTGLVNLTAERITRRPPERDTRCRDCDAQLLDLVHLADHYANTCRPGRRRHPSHVFVCETVQS